MYVAARGWLLAAAFALLAAAGLGTLLMLVGRRWFALVAVALGAVLMIEGLERGYDHLTPRQSGIEVAQKMKPYLRPGTRVYSVNHYDQTCRSTSGAP